MKTFLKNIFGKLRRHLSVSKSVGQPAVSLRVVEPFVTKSNRYKPDELSRFLNDNYRFRFNLLSETTEFQAARPGASGYTLLGEREMNTICIDAFLRYMLPRPGRKAVYPFYVYRSLSSFPLVSGQPAGMGWY